MPLFVGSDPVEGQDEPFYVAVAVRDGDLHAVDLLADFPVVGILVLIGDGFGGGILIFPLRFDLHREQGTCVAAESQETEHVRLLDDIEGRVDTISRIEEEPLVVRRPLADIFIVGELLYAAIFALHAFLNPCAVIFAFVDVEILVCIVGD